MDDPDAAQWLLQNNVEFVPHLAHHHVPLPWGGACDFSSDPEGAGVPLCTDAMLDKAVAFAKGQGLAIHHLMGWNEAYDKGNAKATKKYIEPVTAATYWRTHVQGLAARNNLTLVSPTTGVESNKLAWLGDMLLACWAQRDQGCDVETIAAFSVHDYKCAEPYWRQQYGRGGQFQTKLASHLANAHGSGGKNWTRFVDERLIWVTETNCNGDTGFPPTAAVSAEEQVRPILGRRDISDEFQKLSNTIYTSNTDNTAVCCCSVRGSLGSVQPHSAASKSRHATCPQPFYGYLADLAVPLSG